MLPYMGGDRHEDKRDVRSGHRRASCLSAPVVQAYQGEGAPSKSQPATPDPIGAETITAGRPEPNAMVGVAVFDRNDDRVGSVKMVLRGTDSAAATAVMIAIHSFLGLGDKDVAVRPGDLTWANNRLIVGYTKRELQRAPSIHC